MLKPTIISILDKLIFSCLILYSLTFLIDIPINFLILSSFFCIIKFFFLPPKISIQSKHLLFIFIFIFCTLFITILHPTASLLEYKSRFISPLSVLILLFAFKFTYKKSIILLSGFAFVLSINASIIIFQFFQGEHGRLIGLCQDHYMLLCGFNLLILPILFTLALKKSKLNKIIRMFFFFTIIINIPAIIFENTRIVWLTLGIIFPIIIFTSIKNKKHIILFLSIFILSVYTLFQISPSSLQRFETIFSTDYKVQSNYERILIWQSSINMFIDNPILGVGVGNFHNDYMNIYRSPLSREDNEHSHNNFLLFFSETGFLGGFSFILFLIYLYYYSIKKFFQTKNIVHLCFIYFLLSFTMNCFTDCIFSARTLKPLTYMFWFFITLYLSLINSVKIK